MASSSYGRITSLTEHREVKKPPNRLLERSGTDVSIYPIFHTDANVSWKKSRKAVEIDQVITKINAGFKVLVLLRGLPGSGKSTLAKSILQKTIGRTDENIKDHILSTDDFFMKNGIYNYVSSQIGEAHSWNHQRCLNVMSQGFSPVIIDNTNKQMSEMEPYVRMATDLGYFLEILEPDTLWCFNDKELAKRNKHGVSRSSIKRMLQRYQKNVTSTKLLTVYNCQYKVQNPPQYRQYPPLRNITGVIANPQNNLKLKSSSPPNFMDFYERRPELSTPQRTAPSSSVDDILMNRDAFFKNPALKTIHTAKIKPNSSFSDNINISSWGADGAVLRSWDIATPLRRNETVSKAIIKTDDGEEDVNVAKATAATNTDDNDFYFLRNVLILPPSKGLKVVDTCNRDINQNSSARLQTIKKKFMIDRSCLTEDYLDHHIVNNDNLAHDFLNVSRSVIKYRYEKSHCNFDHTIESSLAEKEEVINVIVEEQAHSRSKQVVDITVDSDSGSLSSEKFTHIRKSKRKNNNSTSDELQELKKHIESKINISSEYYSKKLLRVKQRKYASEVSSSAMTIDRALDISTPEADSKKTESVKFNLGYHFFKTVKNTFGFQPVVQLPVTLARKLYSLYNESVYQQTDAHGCKRMDTLVHEDEDFTRKLQDEQAQATPLQKPISSEIMKEQNELFYWQAEADECNTDTPDTIVARLTEQKLFHSFPSLDQNILLEILNAHNNVYEDTIDTLLASISIENICGNIEAIKEPPLDEITLKEMWEAHESCKQVKIKFIEARTATKYKDKAKVFLKLRNPLYEKAHTYYERGMIEVAHYYNTLAEQQTRLYEWTNILASTAFLDQDVGSLKQFNTLDLHLLYVKEAIPHLDIFLDRNINLLQLSSLRDSECLRIITGRGRNSKDGVPKLKPAVIHRLKERELSFSLPNPGFLKIKLKKSSKFSSEV